MPREPLPIDSVLPAVTRSLAAAGAVVLRAPTGAGKTTRVPPAVLEAGIAGDKLILLLEPRRVAVRAAARRMAAEHGSAPGDTFGYQVRFDRVAGPRTRVLTVTPGILLRMLQADPFLETVGVVVFDEFHERGLDADLALGMLKLVRDSVRPDLKLVVMSATIETGSLAAYLGDCPVVTSDGRSFPVEILYRPRPLDTHLLDAAAAAVRRVFAETAGDILAFFPGVNEIRRAESLLANLGVPVLPLYGDLPPEKQDRALQKLATRKIVLATNVAETSVTVDGVTAVIDTGVARQNEFDAGVGMDRLRLVPISKAAADQRAGRAGRTAPGVCVRLWDELQHRSRPEQTLPEIRRVDLAGAVLQLFAMGEREVLAFPWLEPPAADAVTQAVRVLERLGVVADGNITAVGKTVAELPVPPRLGRMLVEAAKLGVPGRAALAAALLSDRDPFTREPGFAARPASTTSDILSRVEAVEEFERTGRDDFPMGRLHRGGVRNVLDARDQLSRLVRGDASAKRGNTDDSLLRSVFAAFPDRLARRREPGDRRALMVGGRGVKLAPTSGVDEPDLFVCVDVEAGGVDSFVRAASGVERDWLPEAQLVTRHEVEFDADSEKLVARKRTRFADLIIADAHGHFADEAAAVRELAAAAAANLARVLPPADSAAGRFLLRLACLREWMPELSLPAIDAGGLAGMLPDLCRGRRSFAELRGGPWLDGLRGLLTHKQWQAVERDAPDSLIVPTGNAIKLEYEAGRPPVLAVRIQELFGLPETPRVAAGRVPVLLHLLAPNHRPQQVTADLASFWKNGYPVVRKELRGKYPKHEWPDDPLTATPTAWAKRRPPA